MYPTAIYSKWSKIFKIYIYSFFYMHISYHYKFKQKNQAFDIVCIYDSYSRRPTLFSLLHLSRPALIWFSYTPQNQTTDASDNRSLPWSPGYESP